MDPPAGVCANITASLSCQQEYPRYIPCVQHIASCDWPYTWQAESAALRRGTRHSRNHIAAAACARRAHQGVKLAHNVPRRRRPKPHAPADLAATVRLKGLGQLNIAVTSTGIELTTFRLLEQ